MTGLTLQQSIQIVGYAILLGAGIAFCYDLVRLFRMTFGSAIWAMAVQDSLFFVGVGVVTFAFLLCYTKGDVRAFVLVGEGIGVVLYSGLCSKLVLWCLSPIAKILHWIVQKILLPILRIPVKPIAIVINQCQTWKKEKKLQKKLPIPLDK